MTALLLNSAPIRPCHSLRQLLARLAGALDRAVSARAARAVPEWQMRTVQAQIRRYSRSAGRPARRA